MNIGGVCRGKDESAKSGVNDVPRATNLPKRLALASFDKMHTFAAV
jgi:hypothetical protein